MTDDRELAGLDPFALLARQSAHPGDHASDAELDVRRGPDRVQTVGSGPGPLDWRQ
jgi:hypothetical protein